MKETCRLEKYASIISRTHDPKLQEGHLKMMIMILMMIKMILMMMKQKMKMKTKSDTGCFAATIWGIN